MLVLLLACMFLLSGCHVSRFSKLNPWTQRPKRSTRMQAWIYFTYWCMCGCDKVMWCDCMWFAHYEAGCHCICCQDYIAESKLLMVSTSIEKVFMLANTFWVWKCRMRLHWRTISTPNSTCYIMTGGLGHSSVKLHFRACLWYVWLCIMHSPYHQRTPTIVSTMIMCVHVCACLSVWVCTFISAAADQAE